jgi:hypothetical protein
MVAHLRSRVAFRQGQHVQDALAVVRVDRVRQGQHPSIGQGQRAAVAGLAAAARIADGFVQLDAFRGDGNDGGVALVQIGLVVETFAG